MEEIITNARSPACHMRAEIALSRDPLVRQQGACNYVISEADLIFLMIFEWQLAARGHRDAWL